ncbi:MAG: T9SS type A sorting domain-containing protein [Bacteroidales bacterium]|jgi:hypothetical protein|nr:T9SS type A sorting domain-containing protein [Bacteroidales bacterium]MDD4214161.1 T9SS type A sorting domain-containing protein [Bacteroidales bacterium]
MKTKIILLTILLLVTQAADAQIMFQRHYGGQYDDGGSSVLQTDDGGYIIAGRTMSYGNGSNDIYILKTDANGNELWTKTYGGNGWDFPTDIKKTLDNCYIIVGGTSSFGAGASDAFMMKIDNNGDSLWFKTYGGSLDDKAFEVEICEDSGYIISGATSSFAVGFAAAYLIRTNYLGDTLWTKTYEKKDFNVANSIIKTNIDSFILVGVAEIGGTPGADGLVIKTNSIGDTLWMNTYGGASYDEFYSICEDNDGNYLLCGTTYNLTAGSYDVYLVKITNSGGLIWEKSIGGINADNAYSIIKTSDNNFLVVGSTESYGSGGKDVYLIKFNSNGDTLWTRTFGSSGDDMAGSIRETNDGGYIISGITNSFGNNYDIYLIKTDGSGISGINNNDIENGEFIIYPNPSSGTVYLEIPKTIDETVNCEIYSLQGELVQSEKIETNTIKIDLPESGIYFITVTGKSFNVTRKIIIY